MFFQFIKKWEYTIKQYFHDSEAIVIAGVEVA